MENLRFTAAVVMPIMVAMAAGFILKRTRSVSKEFLTAGHGFIYQVAFPFLVFINIYSADLAKAFRGRLILFSCISVAVITLLSIIGYPFLTKDRRKIGVLAQATLRCSYVIFSIYITTQIYGAEGAEITAMLTGFMVPTQVILSIFVLTLYKPEDAGEKLTNRDIALGILKNPLMISIFLGFFFNLLPWKLPSFAVSAFRDIANCATPIGLLILGGELDFSAFSKNMKYVVWGTVSRLVAVPALMLACAIPMGFRGAELVTIMSIAGAPTAMSSFVMAEEMGADGELAGQLVVSTTLFSMFTIFILLLLLRSWGLV